MTKSVFSDRYRNLLSVLSKLRQDKGVTQAQLAISLEKPQSYISKVERGERRIDVIEFINIVEALGGRPADVISSI